jgi:hypothetical protein
MKSKLILLPVSPIGCGGYNMAVSLDIEQLNLSQSDHVIIYNHCNQIIPEGYDYIQRPSHYSIVRITNTLKLRVSTELPTRLLAKKVSGKQYDEVFCGDVMLYKAVRQLFPKHNLTVRFHNFFFLSNTRQKFHRMPIDLKMRLNLLMFSKLEKEILNDLKVSPVFINKTERDFFQLMYPGRKSVVWFPEVKKQTLPTSPKKAALVYFGSHAHHQSPGIKMFISKIFLPLRKKYPVITLNFWGMGGAEYHCPTQGIFYHGDYKGTDLPMRKEALFVNPDLLGGGIKFKVLEWLEKGASFITTPYGIEGYSFKNNENIIVADISEWKKEIECFFQRISLL